MINLDEKFHNYLEKGGKTFRIDGVNEPLTGMDIIVMETTS